MKKAHTILIFSMPITFIFIGLSLLIWNVSAATNTKRSTNVSSAWSIETIDHAGPEEHPALDYISLAVDTDGKTHISYYDSFDTLYGELKYAHSTRFGEWFTETVDFTGGAYTSLALDNEGNPHISYLNIGPSMEVKYVSWTGSHWINETVLTGIGPSGTGFDLILSIDDPDRPYITYTFYQHSQYPSGDSLEYVYWSSNEWITMTIDSDHGRSPSMVIDNDGLVHISYHDRNNSLLNYAQWTGNSWEIETVDNSSYNTSLALDKLGNPYIVYQDHSDYHLKTAHWQENHWSITSISPTIGVSEWADPSMILDNNDRPHLVFRDNGLPVYAYWTGQEWNVEILGDEKIRDVALALDNLDQPVIAYYEVNSRELKLLRRIPNYQFLPFVNKS